MSIKFKGGMAAAAFLLVALLAIAPKASAGDLMYGDATLTGSPVDGADLGLVQQCVSGFAACPGNADATGNDCKIAASDVFALQRFLVISDLPGGLPARNPGVGSGCWAVGLTGPAVVNVETGASTTVPATLSINVAAPRGGLDCAGVVVDFAIVSQPGGCSLSASSAVTDAACNVTVTLNAGGTLGLGEISAEVNLVDSNSISLNVVGVPGNIPFNVGAAGCNITGVAPATGCALDDVTIDGNGFGPSTGTVVFGAIPANVISWNDTTIVVDAPGGNYALVTVTPPAAASCNWADAYSYDGTAPLAPTISPASGEHCLGTTITVVTAEAGPEHCTTDASPPDCTDPGAPATLTVDINLRCIECDACGNPSLVTPRDYTVDVTDPTATINVPAEGADVTTPVTSDIVCSETGTCQEQYDALGWQVCGTSTPLINGAHTIEAYCTDTCGNIGPTTLHNFNVIDCYCPVVGAPSVIQSLPRNGPGNLPPDSVTGNMPVDAYLKFVYDQDVDISGASANMGSLALETTTCTNDTVVWSATLAYETSYDGVGPNPPPLSITGVVDCDESLAAPDINLSLRTARNVVYAAAAADRRAQSGEGFLDGSLQVMVIDDMDGTVIADAVVQINNTVTVDDPGWVNDVYYTDAGGQVMFGLGPVTLNQPITITVMAPQYQYLTWYEQDAREVILGLRHRGEGIAAQQETYIIGDMDPAGLNNGIHPRIMNRQGDAFANPIRLGIASLGFHKRTMSTLATEDILGPNVHHLLEIDTPPLSPPSLMDAAIPSNIFLSDMVIGRNDMPGGFEAKTFFRVKTERTGNVYVNIIGATANIQDISLPDLLGGSADLIDVLTAAKLTATCCDIVRVNILGGAACRTYIMDTTNRGVTQDPMGGGGCTNIGFSGVRMAIDHYSFGWNGQGQTGAVTWTEPGFTFARALRVNMSNWPDDPDIPENYYARLKCTDHNNNPAPCVIPVLQFALLRMDDGTELGVGLSMVNFEFGGVANKLFGFPDLAQLETDLFGAPNGSLEIGAAAAAFSWETRFNLSTGRNLVNNPDPYGQCTSGPCYQDGTPEWMQWVYGNKPVDPGVAGRDDTGNPAVPGVNDLVNRLFEVPELIGSDSGTHPDPTFNSDLLMARLIDMNDAATCLDSSFLQAVTYISGTIGIWSNEAIDNSIWTFYAPTKLVPGTIKIHLPRVPTVFDIDALPFLATPGSAYTFETQAETGVPNGFELSWVHNAINLPTTANINNLVERDAMMYDVDDLSQNRQQFIFQRP